MTPIPQHLARRPVWHGMAVPFVACWGDEIDESKWRLSDDPNLVSMQYPKGERAWWSASWKVGEGTPDLAKLCPQRVRRSILEGLCSICGTKLAAGPGSRWVVLEHDDLVLAQAAENPDQDGVTAVYPWSCGRCLAYSFSACPHLVARAGAGTLVGARLDEWELIRVSHRSDVNGYRVSAVSFLRVRPIAGTFFEADQVAAVLEQERRNGDNRG